MLSGFLDKVLSMAVAKAEKMKEVEELACPDEVEAKEQKEEIKEDK